MNSVPYIMLSASKIHAVGAFRMYRLKTSTQTMAISAMISQAAALPTQVLIPSIVWRKRWTVIHQLPQSSKRREKAPPGRFTEWCFAGWQDYQMGFFAFAPQ